MKCFYFIIPVFILFSCSQPENSTLSIPQIKLNPADTAEIFLEDIADDVSIINLGVAGDTTLKFPNSFFVTDSIIMIGDRARGTIYTYDRKGNALSRIGARGLNLGEYRDMVDVLYDARTKQLEVLDVGLERVFIYNTDGRFIKTLRLANPEKLGLQFAKVGNMYVTPAPALRNGGLMNRLSVFEQVGDVLGYHGSQVQSLPFVNNLHIGYSNQFQNYKDSIFYLPQLDDKIYRLNLKETVAAYQFEFPQGYHIPDEIKKAGFAKDDIFYWRKMQESKLVYNLSGLFITDKWVTFRYDYELMHGSRTAFYSKKTGKVLQIGEYRSRKDTSFKSRAPIVARYGDYFVLPAPIIKFSKPVSKKHSEKGKKEMYIAQHRLIFFKLKDF
jgi:hypothetical protein